MFDGDDWVAMQARAFNGHDLDTLLTGCVPLTRCVRDGEVLGEGIEAVRDGIEAEYRSGNPVVRVLTLNGEQILAECPPEGRSVAGVLRFERDQHHVVAVHIDHIQETGPGHALKSLELTSSR